MTDLFFDKAILEHMPCQFLDNVNFIHIWTCNCVYKSFCWWCLVPVSLILLSQHDRFLIMHPNQAIIIWSELLWNSKITEYYNANKTFKYFLNTLWRTTKTTCLHLLILIRCIYMDCVSCSPSSSLKFLILSLAVISVCCVSPTIPYEEIFKDGVKLWTKSYLKLILHNQRDTG